MNKKKYLLVVGMIENLLHSGGCMANICFNGKQNEKLPESMRNSMESSQESWDVTSRAAREVLNQMKDAAGIKH